jgi:predicted CXXCH cytochrome family protein
MKKISPAFLIIVFVISAMASLARAAGVVDTPHDVRAVDQSLGVCSTCHIPHKSTGHRLWFEPNRGIGSEGAVGILCFSCHSGNSYGPAIFIEASFSEKYVFPDIGKGALSHGMDVDGPYKDGTAGSELTHTPDSIECTTCHNVHDNKTFRPFLRDNIMELCLRCHNKDNNHAADINAEIVKDGEDSFLKLMWSDGFVAKASLFELLSFDNPFSVTDVKFGDGYGRWNLGRHLGVDVKKVKVKINNRTVDAIEGGVPGNGLEGGIICVTCHAVHGVQDDSDANTPIDIPRKNLLPDM